MSKAVNPGDAGYAGPVLGIVCTPLHSPGTGSQCWAAILTMGSKAWGAMTTEGKIYLHLPHHGHQLGLPLIGSAWRGRGRTVLMTAQSGS